MITMMTVIMAVNNLTAYYALLQVLKILTLYEVHTVITNFYCVCCDSIFSTPSLLRIRPSQGQTGGSGFGGGWCPG